VKFLQLQVIPYLVALLLHGVLLVVVTLNWQSQTHLREIVKTPPAIQAKIVKLEEVRPKAKPKPKKKPQPRVKAKPKPRAKPKPKPVIKPKVDKSAEIKKKRAEEKALEEQRKRLEEQRRREQELLAQQQLADALQDEEEFLQEQTDEEVARSYTGVIKETIPLYWDRPPSARNNMEVTLLIQLVPTGEVVNVAISKSSGNEAFDRSAVNAVKKAERFPELQKMPPNVFEKHFRRFILVFRPEDLRL
jgi:colicin import membrane protein